MMGLRLEDLGCRSTVGADCIRPSLFQTKTYRRPDKLGRPFFVSDLPWGRIVSTRLFFRVYQWRQVADLAKETRNAEAPLFF